MQWESYNANPQYKRVGDCTVRAISKALDQDWETTFLWLCLYGFIFSDMPSSNQVWGAYLRDKGFVRHANDCECVTVECFCKENPNGCYILSLDKHVVTVIDGVLYDTWDSSDEIVIYYWKKER